MTLSTDLQRAMGLDAQGLAKADQALLLQVHQVFVDIAAADRLFADRLQHLLDSGLRFVFRSNIVPEVGALYEPRAHYIQVNMKIAKVLHKNTVAQSYMHHVLRHEITHAENALALRQGGFAFFLNRTRHVMQIMPALRRLHDCVLSTDASGLNQQALQNLYDHLGQPSLPDRSPIYVPGYCEGGSGHAAHFGLRLANLARLKLPAVTLQVHAACIGELSFIPRLGQGLYQGLLLRQSQPLPVIPEQLDLGSGYPTQAYLSHWNTLPEPLQRLLHVMLATEYRYRGYQCDRADFAGTVASAEQALTSESNQTCLSHYNPDHYDSPESQLLGARGQMAICRAVHLREMTCIDEGTAVANEDMPWLKYMSSEIVDDICQAPSQVEVASDGSASSQHPQDLGPRFSLPMFAAKRAPSQQNEFAIVQAMLVLLMVVMGCRLLRILEKGYQRATSAVEPQ